MKTCNNLWRSVLLTCFVLFAASAAHSQQSPVSKYTETTFSGSFSSITGTGSWLDWWDDDVYGLSMPFAFNYDSTNYNAGSTLYLCTNGWLGFSNNTPYSPYNRFGTSTMLNTMGFWAGDGFVNDGIYYEVTGTAPNRVLTIEWSDFSWWDWGYDANDDPTYWTSVQVKLYETTNKIEFLYADHDFYMNDVWYGEGAKIGLEGQSASDIIWSGSTGSTYTPSSDIRWTPAPLPPPPGQLSVSPKSIDFGPLNARDSLTQCVTMTDVGPGTLFFTATSISGNTADFTVVSGPAVADSFHTNDQATICVRFSPTASGTRTAILRIQTTGRDSGTQTVTLTGNGVAPDINAPITDILRKVKVRVGDSLVVAVPVQSTGTGPLQIDSAVVVGLNPDQYHVWRLPTQPILPGNWDTVFITFAPTFEGKPDATILIYSTALNFPQVAIHTFGVGTMPRLAIDPQALDFDSVYVGQQICRDVRLYNTGTDTVAILKTLKVGGDYDFTFTPLAHGDTLIPPGGQKMFNICFLPLRNGLRTATIRFYTNIALTYPEGLDTSQVVLHITGTGVPYGQLQFSGDVVDTAVVGIENCVTETITNVGSADITITSAKLVGRDSLEFSYSGLNFPMTIAPNATVPVTFCLTPTMRGDRIASLVLTGTSDGTAASVTLPLAGYGVEVCASSSPTSAFGTPMTAVGRTDTATITVTNCGDIATSYSAALPSGVTTYTLVGAATSPVVNPAGTATFKVAFTPSAIGTDASNLTITGGTGVTPMTIALGGVGSGVTATATTADAGMVAKGECKDFSVTITNTGNVDWTPGTISITGANAADFTFVSLTPTTIAAGGTGTLTLRFCPTTTTSEGATASFNTASPMPITAFSIPLSGTGQVNAVAEIVRMNGFELGANYPNPVQHTSDISVTVPQAGLVTIELVDLTGHVVRTIASERMPQGVNTITIDANGLASGTYYYVLTSGSTRLMRQLVVTK